MENETKKKPNLIAIGIAAAIIAVIALGFIKLNAGRLDAKDIVTVNIRGVEGKGKASAALNYSLVESEMKFKGDNEFGMFGTQLNFEDSVKIDVTPSEDLKNGDKITVTLSCDKASARKLGLKLGKMKFTQTVSDLPEAEPIDPFEGLSVSFDGVSPYGSVKIDKNNCNDFTKNHVNFVYDTNAVKNGDKIKIAAQYNESAADEAMVYITETEKEYEVTGLGEYITSLDDTDMTDIETALSDKILSVVSKSRSTGLIFGIGYLAGTSFNVTSNCKLQDLNVVERYLFSKKPDSYESTVNILYTVYEISINEENGNSQKMFINTAVSDIIKQDDGSLTYSMADPHGYTSLEGVHNKLNSIKDNYTSEQLGTDGVIIPEI